MLQAHAIQMEYPTPSGPLVVLRDASLTLDAGDSAAVMGPSGSGKSTLLNILGTLDTPTAGRLTINGCDPSTLPERELADFRNQRIGFIFQDHHLLPQLTALENVLLPTLAGPRKRSGQALVPGGAPHPPGAALKLAARPADAVAHRAAQLLERLGLADRAQHHPAELSGGERQRVAIARALINRPALLLADEPTGNLDHSTAQQIADVLVEMHSEEKNVLVIVTHSEELAQRTARRFVLTDGTLLPR